MNEIRWQYGDRPNELTGSFYIRSTATEEEIRNRIFRNIVDGMTEDILYEIIKDEGVSS